MTIETWKRIARQHDRYGQLLADRLQQAENAIERTDGTEELTALVSLYERLERHYARMRRHSEKVIQALPAGRRT